MVEGGRNLEQEIMRSFFEELERTDSIPLELVEELEQLDSQGDLTDAKEVRKITEATIQDAHSED